VHLFVPGPRDRLTCEQVIKRAISDIGYVLKLEGKLREIVSHAYILSLEYTHGESTVHILL
jgi:hypothetical protein